MNTHEKCYCNDKHAIIIGRKSASRVASCIALGAFLVFTTGYFIGKKHAFHDELENQEIALLDKRMQYVLDDKTQIEVPHESKQVQNENEPHPLITADIQCYTQNKNDVHNDVHYVALLAGYRTQRAAQQFVQSLEKKGIKTEVKKRVSANSKEQRAWYQVVTQQYDNKSELADIVDRLKREEHITNDIDIVEVT